MNKFDEYTFFAESTQQLSERRQAATEVYLGVNTAIFALIAFLLKDAGLEGAWQPLLALPLFGVGVFACFAWYKLIARYRTLIAWRYEQLIVIEETLPESHRMFSKEWAHFFGPNCDRERIGFSVLEEWLPKIVLALYVLYGLGLAASRTLPST